MSDTRISASVRDRTGSTRSKTFAGDRPLWIGRDDSCDLILASDKVSRRHACAVLHEGKISVRDASSNGTWLDGQRLSQDTHTAGTRAELSIGPYQVRMRVVEGPDGGASGAHGADVRKRIRAMLLESLDLPRFDVERHDRPQLERRVRAALSDICDAMRVAADRRAELIDELCDEALGLGPLEPLLDDASVSEIMVVDPRTIYVERAGKLERCDREFTDDEAVRAALERIVTPLGRRIDESSPVVDARLPDGSRVNAIIPPLATKGPCITIRKFSEGQLTLAHLVSKGAMSQAMATLLERAVGARRNIVISGGTGSGKTTLLNALAATVPAGERIVTIEDAAELKLGQEHVVTLEARPPNMEGRGAYTVRDLLKNALRMRPDRIIVGECRGGEALDMLQAMNTGHEGSMTTTHANSPREAIARLETLVLMSGLDLPVRAIRQQIGGSIHLLVQQTRLSDGRRVVTDISEITGVTDDGEVAVQDIYRFRRSASDDEGTAGGRFIATGYLPGCLTTFIAQGLVDSEQHP